MATTTKTIGVIGMTFKGEYSSSVEYGLLQVVTYRNSSFICKVASSTGASPLNTTNWEVLNYGMYYVGEWTNGVTYSYMNTATVTTETSAKLYMCNATSSTEDPTTSSHWVALT